MLNLYLSAGPESTISYCKRPEGHFFAANVTCLSVPLGPMMLFGRVHLAWLRVAHAPTHEETCLCWSLSCVSQDILHFPFASYSLP